MLNDDDIPLETVNSRPTPFGAHRLAYIISVLEDETRDVPVAQAGGECEVYLTNYLSYQFLMALAGLWMVVLRRFPWTNGRSRYSETQDMVYHME